MRTKTLSLLLSFSGLLLLAMGIWLLTPQTVEAQCGSQASSCKNCHEVQATDPVNNDGTGWHESHAFGDFCYICHAGNQQATDEESAHAGMVAPLSDIKASCQQCHPNDLTDRAQVYAVALGIDLSDSGSSGTLPSTSPTTQPPTGGSSTTTDTQPSSNQASLSLPATSKLVLDDPNVVDYAQRYDEIVLGIHPTNVGNVILGGLIGLLLIGGGGIVMFNERRIHATVGTLEPVNGTYPADVVEMLPALAKLQLKTRVVLKSILENPRKTEKVLGLIDEVVEDDDNKEQLR